MHVGGHKMVLPELAPRLSKTPGGTQWAGGELGEHSAEVLSEWAGMQPQAIADLVSAGVLWPGA